MPAPRKSVAPPAPVTIPATRPDLLRDPWLLALLAALVVLVVRTLGAPLGEPVADDFDHLHHVLFADSGSWFDGGGSVSFWRPLAYQGWYGLWHGVILTHPAWLSVVHLLLLALATVLLYDLARDRLPGPTAAAVAAFPLGLEATRALLIVPVHIVDLGLIVASVVALHAAARGRLVGACVALVAALLCKETAVVTAVMLPWLAPRASRRALALSTGGVTLVWAGVYLAVRHHMALTLPHGLEAGLGPALLIEGARHTWAITGTLRALVSLPRLATGPEALVVAIVLALAGLTALRFTTDAAARARVASVRGLIVGGLAWTALATLTLLPVYPVWSPERVVFTSLGAGLALCATLAAAHPALLAGLVALRLATFMLAPGAPATVTREVADRGAFVDFERLARLQRLAREARVTLEREFPSLPHGASVVLLHPPFMTDYALGDRALQVWRRDPSLHWRRWDGLTEAGAASLAGALEFREDLTPPFRRVEPRALAGWLVANRLQLEGHIEAAYDTLRRADALQTDREATHTLGRIFGLESWLLGLLGRFPEAEARAHAALRLSSQDAQAHLTLAALHENRREYAAALAQVDSVLVWYPGFVTAQRMRRGILQASGTPAAASPAGRP